MVKKTNYCICDAVLENTLIDEDITAVDLGIGVLYIKRADLEGNIIKYRFEPSPALDKAIKDTIINKQNLLEDMILIAVNDGLKKISKMKEEKMGKYTGGLGGLF